MVAMLVGTTTVRGEDILVRLPAETSVEILRSDYRCGKDTIKVEYINAGSVNLARLVMDDGTIVVASNVIAASGAKYAGGQYVWWTKGAKATLYDLMNGGAHTGVVCTSP